MSTRPRPLTHMSLRYELMTPTASEQRSAYLRNGDEVPDNIKRWPAWKSALLIVSCSFLGWFVIAETISAVFA